MPETALIGAVQHSQIAWRELNKRLHQEEPRYGVIALAINEAIDALISAREKLADELSPWTPKETKA